VARAASDAFVALHRAGHPVRPALRTALRSDVPLRRFGAAATCARVAPPGPELLPALVEGLGSPERDVRWAAARLLTTTGRLHGEVLPLLLGLVRRGEQAMLRRMATFCLRELAPDRPEAARELLAASRDEDLHVRRAALVALAGLFDPPPEVAERLLEVVASEAEIVSRRLAALALGELASTWPDVVPARAEALLRGARETADDADLVRALDRSLERMRRAPAAEAPPPR
jgi:HEAT repeat protein